MIKRFDNNPIIAPRNVRPSRPDFEVMCAFNAGATRCDGKVVLLVRVAERPVPRQGYVSTAMMNPETRQIEPLYIKSDDPELKMDDPRAFLYKGTLYLTSISHLRMAESLDGRYFTVSESPAMLPENRYETYGIEDPRITFIEGWYYINYSAISLLGVATSLARTKDFKTYERLGVIFGPENKDIAIFPERIDGRYYAFHRPAPKNLGTPSMWLASSDNLLDWGRHEYVIGPRAGFWDCERVGCGAAPIRTREGWLELYHASDRNTRYCTGALLLDLKEPWKVLARSDRPVFAPEASYETSGFLPNVIFHNGLVENGDGTLTLYYGAADDKTCGATVRIEDILTSLEPV